MCGKYDESKMACMGALTISDGDFEECQACGDRVAADLVDHPLFSFKYCNKRRIPGKPE